MVGHVLQGLKWDDFANVPTMGITAPPILTMPTYQGQIKTGREKRRERRKKERRK